MGAALGFELARELRRRGLPQPLHLFVSGRRAPQLPAREEPIHEPARARVPGQAARAQRHAGRGAPARGADEASHPHPAGGLPVNETYEFVPEEPLDIGLSAFGGLGDEDVTRDDVAAWQQHTTRPFPDAHAAGRPLLHPRLQGHGPRSRRAGPGRDLRPRSRRPGERRVPSRVLRPAGLPWRRARSTSGRSRLDPPCRSGRAAGPLPLSRRMAAGEPLPLRQAPPAVRGGPWRPAHPARPPTRGPARSW